MASRELLIFQALFGNGPPGMITLHDFCRAVDAGETPPAEVLQACSRAFKRILAEQKLQDGLMFFADDLQLHKPKTRIKKAAGDDPEDKNLPDELALVIEVLKLERAEEMKPSKAKKEIRRRGITKLSLRTIQRYYEEHQEAGKWFLDNFKI